MRRIFFGTGTLVLGLSSLMWAAVFSSAQHGGHGGGHASAGHASAGHAVAHVGSVHYAVRTNPARVAPPVRSGAVRAEHYAGAVRAEHYAGAEHGGAHRNPYREEYVRHFRPGYRSFLIGDASYYYYYDLPPDCQTVVINGITYYLCNGVYYEAYLYGGQTV
jgi:hypothetical protein